jgi:hypothetical protein
MPQTLAAEQDTCSPGSPISRRSRRGLAFVSDFITGALFHAGGAFVAVYCLAIDYEPMWFAETKKILDFAMNRTLSNQ